MQASSWREVKSFGARQPLFPPPALSQDIRTRRAEIASVDNAKFWAALEAVWEYLSQSTDADGIDGLDVAVCLSLSRFTRNVVAGVPINQVHALYAYLLQRLLELC